MKRRIQINLNTMYIMKILVLMISLSLSFLGSFGQVVTVTGNKVEVRDIKGKYIASSYYSSMNDAIAGDGIVVIWHKNNKVEVRTENLGYISSSYYSNLRKVATTGKNIVLYYKNNKMEVRNVNLKYISSRYQ